jgi:hypothetical protein
MFWAALAAECSGETSMTANRIAASLLRTNTLRTFCSRAQIDDALLLSAIDDPQTSSFEECERRVMRKLAEDRIEFGSKEHQATVQRRPLEPVVRRVLDPIIERHGGIGVSPLVLLRDLIRAEPVLAERLAPHGLNLDAISAALENEEAAGS